MSAISRRTFLQQAPVAAVIAATPAAVAVAEVRPTAVEDGDTKCMRLARDLFDAMKAHYGDGCKMIHNEDNGAVFFLPPPAPPRIVEFAGPGWYEIESKGPNLPTEELWIDVDVRFLSHPDRGRFFKAIPRERRRDVRHYEESWLRQIIVRKI